MNGIQVIGIGNPDRGDDAIGPSVIDALRECGIEQRIPRLTLTVARNDMLALLDLWQTDSLVFLVDALAAGSEPGRILRIAVGDLSGVLDLDEFASTHAFDLGQALALGEALSRLPRDLVLYGIEGTSFEIGAPLSESARAAVIRVVRQITEECDQCTKPH